MYVWEVMEAADAAAMNTLLASLIAQNYSVNQLVARADGSYAILVTHYQPPEA